jgi:hypothetical protein
LKKKGQRPFLVQCPPLLKQVLQAFLFKPIQLLPQYAFIVFEDFNLLLLGLFRHATELPF